MVRPMNRSDMLGERWLPTLPVRNERLHEDVTNFKKATESSPYYERFMTPWCEEIERLRQKFGN